jgi:hypothetical protein
MVFKFDVTTDIIKFLTFMYENEIDFTIKFHTHFVKVSVMGDLKSSTDMIVFLLKNNIPYTSD